MYIIKYIKQLLGRTRGEGTPQRWRRRRGADASGSGAERRARVLFVCKCVRFLYTRRTAEKDFWDWKLNKSTPERKMVFGGGE